MRVKLDPKLSVVLLIVVFVLNFFRMRDKIENDAYIHRKEKRTLGYAAAKYMADHSHPAAGDVQINDLSDSPMEIASGIPLTADE